MKLPGTIRRRIPKPLKDLIRPAYEQVAYLVTGITSGSLSHDRIARLLAKPDPVIFEIGCNDGSDTLEFLRRFPSAKLHCFEPDIRAIERFRRKLGCDLPRVRLFEMAIAERTGWMEFHTSDGEVGDQPEGWDYSGSVRAPKNHLSKHPYVRFDKVENIRTVTLDEICSELGIQHIDFIWMDVQGAERDVLLGGRTMLRNIDYIYTEYSNEELYQGQPSLKELKLELPEFDLLTLYPGDALFRNRRLRARATAT